MKKILAVLALAFAGSAFAGGSGVTMEYESEHGAGKDQGSNSNSIAIAPYIKFGDRWKADIKFEGGRDTGTENGNNKPMDGLIEARIRKDVKITEDWKVGLRLGIGEKINGSNKDGTVTDFTYYTVEPITYYNLTEPWTINASVRYRNAFDQSNYNYQTTTYKLGTAYKVTNEDEVGVKYYQKYGDFRSNGVELTYTRGF